MTRTVVHVSDAYLPKRGGIETQVHHLAMRQSDRGDQVHIVTRQGAPNAISDDLPTRRLPFYPWVWRTPMYLNRVLRELQPEVLHVHLSVVSPLGLLAIFWAYRHRKPVLVTVHSLWDRLTWGYRLADRICRWGSWPVQWTAVSDLAAQPIRRVIGARGDVPVIPNGVNAQPWREATAGAGLTVPHNSAGTRPTVVVATVMRLALRKRPFAFARMMRDARRELGDTVDLRAVVIGDGPQRRRLQRRLSRYQLTDAVQLLGERDHTQIRQLYREVDLYLAPATLEAYGIAALEARCAGLPVLALRATGIADFITHERHGLLADDDDALAAGLARAASDYGLRAAMQQHNRADEPAGTWMVVLDACDAGYERARQLVQPQLNTGSDPMSTLS